MKTYVIKRYFVTSKKLISVGFQKSNFKMVISQKMSNNSSQKPTLAKRDKTRICVIGAGPGGLLTLRALQSLEPEQDGKAEAEGRNSYEVVCYERYAEVGGLWNFKGIEGLEEDGMEPHSSMYHNLISNNPKYFVENPEYLYPQNDPTLTGFECFPSYKYQLSHIQNFCSHYGLQNYIRFKKWVEWVQFNEETGKFEVTVRDLKSENRGAKIQDFFDYVIVATGHFSKPNLVSYPGEETFPGPILHSKYFIDANRFKGKRLLVVGSGFSAEDLAVMSVKAGAIGVTVSYRVHSLKVGLPPQIEERPILENINGRTVRFSDGSSAEYDVIIYCTGYLHDFPFMEEKLRLVTKNRMAPPLYKQLVFPGSPRVLYVGMQNLVYTFPLFWLQGYLCAGIIKGDVKIPSRDVMDKEIADSQANEKKIKSKLDLVDFQTQYLNRLSELLNKPSVDGNHMAKQWLQDRRDDIMTYKQKTHYKSKYR